jgi:hypothetical protein
MLEIYDEVGDVIGYLHRGCVEHAEKMYQRELEQ